MKRSIARGNGHSSTSSNPTDLKAMEQIIARSVALAANWRRKLHQMPELAFEEKKTAAFVRGQLKGLGLRVHPPFLGTDVIADLLIPGAKAFLGLRADLDGLPIQEACDVPWKSRHAGFMHACGHDGHTAILLATARTLSLLKGRVSMNVRFIFQPGEEVRCGAEPLVKTGILDPVGSVYALHGWPGLPLGVISSRPGAIFAAGFFYRMELTGRGTHGATPEKGRNPLSAAGELALAIERLHDKWNRKTGAVLSLCRSEGGHTSNVIPSKARLFGTFRCLAAGEGARLESELRSVARAVCRRRRIALALSVDRNYRYPVLNSPACVERVRRAAIAMGRGVWREAPAPSMASEDFAHMLRKVPGAMFRLGLGKAQPPLHSDGFDFPDRALENGIRLFVSLALGERPASSQFLSTPG